MPLFRGVFLLVKMSDLCAYWSILAISCTAIVPFAWFQLRLIRGCGVLGHSGTLWDTVGRAGTLLNGF